MTGPPKDRARRSADSIARTSWPSYRADVLEAEVLEHALRGQDVLEALLDGVQRVVERRAHHRGAVQRLAHLQQGLLVARAQPSVASASATPPIVGE
jgi:hypothetical protein